MSYIVTDIAGIIMDKTKLNILILASVTKVEYFLRDFFCD